MADGVAARLAELGVELPSPAAPAANYAPFRISGGALYVSGQLPMRDGALAYAGQLGDGVSLDDGVAAARLCMINVLAQARAACGGDLERIAGCLRLGGFVNCVAGYADQAKVINGASDLALAALGDAGRHARAAVGVSALPFNAAVEVDAIFEIKV